MSDKDKLRGIAEELSGEVLRCLVKGREALRLSQWAGSTLAFVLSHVHEGYPLLCVMDDADAAGYLYSDLEQIVGGESVHLFPSAYRRAIKYGHRDESNALLRSMVLTAIAQARAEGKPCPIVVTYPEALAESVSGVDEVAGELMILKQGMNIGQEIIAEQLYEWGYERTDYVYEPGQYALRGSIFDIYSYTSERPYRLDFFWDELESLRTFEVESQLSVERLQQVTLAPNLGSSSAEGVSLVSLMPHDAVVCMPTLAWVEESLELTWTDEPKVQDGEGFASLWDLQAVQIAPDETLALLAQHRHIYYRGDEGTAVALHTEAQPMMGKDYARLSTQLSDWVLDGYRLWISARDDSQWTRIVEILHEHRPHMPLPERLERTLHEGFVCPNARVALLTEHQIFGRYHKYNLRSDKARSGKITLSLKELSTFAPGDLVVHTDYGVGRFGGLMQIALGERMQEVVKIEYNKGDSIYVGLHSLHKLSPYRQKEAAEAVALSTIGSKVWERTKERTKRQVKDIARGLIRLYKERRESQGFAFSPDSYLQHELEASFAYDPTPDQLKATEDIKADMERPYPMDRLLCGDVGFGKTEVAIRAAFKAATDGKQVAVLVPTTVLAYQHYRTFSARLSGMPVRVDYLSRARTTAETKAILADLKAGKIDIIIGTHRLTSKGVAFHDLGLLIIDEEQKFGVSTKEKLRQLQINVDTLTMSATPIPRTLQFSLMGARDLSNITTPPDNRMPIETILTRFSADTMSEAINFELSRNGQVFVLHNRVQNIEEVASMIRRSVPDARVVVGHGQMAPADLERILIEFAQHEYDVLVATTIIENGIDVPNANTILINDAHRYGLSELHQLRGRVGRGARKAFCYMLTPPLATLTDEARRRVRAIENFSDLGSGVRIALQDLDIRGAGNALGAEQSGFITDMGYETYQKVFNEAINELKADEFADLYADASAPTSAAHLIANTQVDSDLELALPADYVPTDAERILLYRELDGLDADAELEGYRSRLVDRFGTPPEVVEELIRVPRLRRLGRGLGVEKIVLRSDVMSLYLPIGLDNPYYQSEVAGMIIDYVGRHTRRCELRQRDGRYIVRFRDVTSITEALNICHTIRSAQ